MQQLHLVGFTTDLEGLIFSARRGAKSGSFVVPLDDKLVATIAEAHRRRNGDAGDGGALADLAATAAGKDRPSRPPRPDSRLNPREIQGRLRAGRTIEEVAREANVDTEWVERWAAPVMAEQQKVVARARGLVFSKARGGASVEPLGRSVAWNVADKGVWLPPEQFDRSWSAYQSLDTWIVRFNYRSRGRDHVAEWEVDGDELVALDRIASQLAYLDRARRRKAPPRAEITEAPEPTVGLVDAAVTVAEEEEAPAPARRAARKATNRRARTGANQTAAKASPAKKTAAKKRVSKKRVSKKKSVAKKAPARKVSARKASARKLTAARRPSKAPVRKAPVAKKAAGRTRSTRTSPAKKTAARSSAARKVAKKAPVARKGARKTAGARKASRKAAGSARAAGRRPPAAVPGVARESRARLAASDMLSTEPDLVEAPRFGTPGNPPARRSGAGGKRTVVRARGRKKAAATRESQEEVVETVEPEVADVEELEADDAAWQRAASAAPDASARRTGRRQPRLRATVRRREREESAPDAESDVAVEDDAPAVVPVPRPGKARSQAMIAADRAGDLVGDGEAGDEPTGGDEIADSGEVVIAGDDAGETATVEADGEGAAPEGRRRRRRLLRR